MPFKPPCYLRVLCVSVVSFALHHTHLKTINQHCRYIACSRDARARLRQAQIIWQVLLCIEP
jgi:hypothetical protein